MAMDPKEIFLKLERWHRAVIVAAVCLLLLVPFYFFVVQDMLKEKAALGKAISEVKIQIANEQNILAQGPGLKKRIEELQQQLHVKVQSLPERQEIESLLKRITDLMSETNLVAGKFVPGGETKNAELRYATIPISFNVTGDYFKQGNFLRRLLDLPRVVNVVSIALKPIGAGSGAEGALAAKLDVLNLDAQLSAQTYRRLTQAEIQALAAQKKAPAKAKAPAKKHK
jgi:type IV pilus assembly protein PilO